VPPNTRFTTVPANASCQLPLTTGLNSLAGTMIYVGNLGANSINCFPHPSDPNNSINGQAANTVGGGALNAGCSLQ
jgi:hypothetical protein